jgi:hypothetical protein
MKPKFIVCCRYRRKHILNEPYLSPDFQRLTDWTEKKDKAYQSRISDLGHLALCVETSIGMRFSDSTYYATRTTIYLPFVLKVHPRTRHS